MSKQRYYYTKWEIFVAWIKKLLGIKSPSAIYCSDGKYEYAYDFIMKTKSKIKG